MEAESRPSSFSGGVVVMRRREVYAGTRKGTSARQHASNRATRAAGTYVAGRLGRTSPWPSSSSAGSQARRGQLPEPEAHPPLHPLHSLRQQRPQLQVHRHPEQSSRCRYARSSRRHRILSCSAHIRDTRPSAGKAARRPREAKRDKGDIPTMARLPWL